MLISNQPIFVFCFCFVLFCFVSFPGPCLVHRQKHTVKMYDSSTEIVTESWLVLGGYDEALPEEAATYNEQPQERNPQWTAWRSEKLNEQPLSLKKREPQWTASKREHLSRRETLNGLPQEERTSTEEKTSTDCLKKNLKKTQ